MFTYQSPQINQALWLSGLSNQSVSAFQNLVGQCRAPLVHRGPITFDYTRPEMRLITPESRVGKPPFEEPFEEPQNFPEQPEEDPLEPEMPPGKRKGPFLPPEHFPFDPPQEGNDGPDRRAPENKEYKAGPYINIDNKVISLKADDIRRHCVFPVGKNTRDKIGGVDFIGKATPEDYIGLSIKDNRLDTTFTVELKKLELVEFVHSVELTATGLMFYKKQAWVFEPQDITSDLINVVGCD